MLVGLISGYIMGARAVRREFERKQQQARR